MVHQADQQTAVHIYTYSNDYYMMHSITERVNTVHKQVLQQQAYHAMWPLLIPKTLPSLGLSPQK